MVSVNVLIQLMEKTGRISIIPVLISSTISERLKGGFTLEWSRTDGLMVDMNVLQIVVME